VRLQRRFVPLGATSLEADAGGPPTCPAESAVPDRMATTLLVSVDDGLLPVHRRRNARFSRSSGSPQRRAAPLCGRCPRGPRRTAHSSRTTPERGRRAPATPSPPPELGACSGEEAGLRPVGCGGAQVRPPGHGVVGSPHRPAREPEQTLSPAGERLLAHGAHLRAGRPPREIG
jgi:hypothetical protein